MEYFAGLDVSVKETSVCIVDDGGRIVREAKVGSEPEALLQVLMTFCQGLQAGLGWKRELSRSGFLALLRKRVCR